MAAIAWENPLRPPSLPFPPWKNRGIAKAMPELANRTVIEFSFLTVSCSRFARAALSQFDLAEPGVSDAAQVQRIGLAPGVLTLRMCRTLQAARTHSRQQVLTHAEVGARRTGVARVGE